MAIDTDAPTTTLILSRCFDAPRERVFDAWVTKVWCDWMGPRDFRCEAVEIDAWPGGRYQVRMRRPDGSAVKISGIYREISRPEKLVFTWMGDYHTHETLITVRFVADGSGTMMTLTQEGFATLQDRDGHKEGWSGENGCFDKLEKYLAG